MGVFDNLWGRRRSPSALPPLRPKVLHTHEALRAMGAHVPPKTRFECLAFYSSVMGGITTDPALMTIPIDDHMAHRGHAVFDTANIVNGRCYGLDMHLDRLLRSAGLARIKPAFLKEELRQLILATIAAGQEREGVFVRFWMSAGRGDFAVSSKETTASNFFVVVHRYRSKAEPKLHGIAEYTVDIPLKPPLLATIKSNNYLINALTCEAAEDQGGYLGIQLDEAGRVAESSIGNVAILDASGVLRTPPFTKVLAGTTVRRLWELVADSPLVLEEKGGVVKRVEYSEVTLEDFYGAREAYSLGGGSVLPIVSLNGRPIGGGKPGPVFKELDALLAAEMATESLDEIPYKEYSTSIASLLWRRILKVVKKMDLDSIIFFSHLVAVAYGLGRARGHKIYI